MATINAIAHKNELTKDDPNDYYLLPQVTASLSVEDIIERIAKREIATTSVNGTAFVHLFLKECAAAAAEGNNIVTDLFRSSISIKGCITSKDLGHEIDANRLRVSINLTQGTEAIEAISKARVYAYLQPGATGPIIQNVCDPTTNEPNQLPFRGMALIQGMNLSLKGDDPTVGTTFTPVDPAEGDSPVLIQAKMVTPNTSTKLQFVLPAEVTTGDWRVKVTTQSSGSYTTKEPRSYEYPEVVSVY